MTFTRSPLFSSDARWRSSSAAAEFVLFADKALILLQQDRFRIHQQFTAIAIDNQRMAMQQRGLNIGAHHRWDAEARTIIAAWELAAPSRTTTPAAILRHFGEVVADSSSATRIMRAGRVGPLNTVVEMEQQTLAQGTQIAGPLFK